MRCLVLATASAARVQAATADLSARHRDAKVVVGGTAAQRRGLAARGLEVIELGVDDLELDRSTVRAAIAGAAPDLVAVPLDLPLQPLRYVARLVDHLGGVAFEVWLGRGLHWHHPVAVRLTLFAYSWLLFPLPGLLIRAGRVVDGALLLGLHLLARVSRRPSPRPSDGAGVIAHVITSLRSGGAQRQLSGYLGHTSSPRSQTVVLALDPVAAPELEAEVTASGVTLEYVGDLAQERGWSRLGLRLVPRFTWSLLVARRLAAWRPRCVVSWLFLANVVAVPAARLLGVQWIVSSVRNLSAWKRWPGFREWWFRTADRSTAGLSDVILGNSRAVAEDYVRWSGADPARVRVIHNGIEPSHASRPEPTTSVRSALTIPDAAPLLLAAGRLSREKNLVALVPMMVGLRTAHDCHLVIVGEGPERTAIETAIAAHGLERVIHLLGHRDDLGGYYRAADLFLLPSFIEGMPNVVMEAQLHGLAVICTASGGSAEVVDHGNTGLVVPVDQPSELLAAVRSLLADPARARAMGQRGAERIRSHFTITASTEALDAVIREGLALDADHGSANHGPQER